MTEEFDMSNLKEFDKVLNKKFGSQYTGFGEKDNFEKVSRVPLECISLNNILGGGIPEGRLIEIFGRNSSGKSSLANHIVSSYQKKGKYCMWIDSEACFDPVYTSNCGVNLDSLCKVSPNSAEEALEAIRTGLNLRDKDGNPILSLIVLDSLAALTPRVDFDENKEIGTTQIGSLARLLSTSLKQIVTLAAETKATVILLNQERATNIGGLNYTILC
jgi:recombination protein RecA